MTVDAAEQIKSVSRELREVINAYWAEAQQEDPTLEPQIMAMALAINLSAMCSQYMDPYQAMNLVAKISVEVAEGQREQFNDMDSQLNDTMQSLMLRAMPTKGNA